jgi:hypothetical protein
LLGESVLTGDVVPDLLYPAPLPLGIAALVRAMRADRRLEPSQAAA